MQGITHQQKLDLLRACRGGDEDQFFTLLYEMAAFLRCSTGDILPQIIDGLGRGIVHYAAQGWSPAVKKIIMRSIGCFEPFQTGKLKLFLNGKDRRGNTPFLEACERDAHELVRILLITRTPITQKNNFCETGLHLAVRKGHLLTIKLLLERGALLNSQNNNGETPLHVGVREGMMYPVDDLLAHGASIGICNH
ncbi:ankyrin repeat-containing domain protein [Hypoxylon fragiforme]|uniref:ankyrin repeat-containing domain protein n=1 Tax=Hypoxylon fragiforme TaxID=63214 RepID=UPI0020C70A62|nr:ankyrin repeat-containing domain protein [Hypoxylon fragiforme]KAI2614717.1 ankyrin repeat-containing domain protein [Hypoxylon fragiforme]